METDDKKLDPTDGGNSIDWGRTSDDYARHRPGPPSGLYDRWTALGYFASEMRVLDLGTGTGLIARELARRGAIVHGCDIAEGQIEMARALAAREGLQCTFSVAPAEATGVASASFDLVTAHQCWLYFDKPKAIAEVRRVLRSGGHLITAHFSWLPRKSEIARASEALVLKYNPKWTSGDWPGVISPAPAWAEGLRPVGFFVFDQDIEFTRESWRGRIRACRGVGAALEPAAVEAFDREHAELLRGGPEKFTIPHRIDSLVFAFDG